jgi:hypothetical protein
MAHAGGFEAGRELGMKQERERNNEPVAELVLEQMAVGDASSLRVKWLTDSYPPVGTKLYTHPVKEMSETRIKQIFVEQTGFYFDDNPADDLALMDFAKALLLEAQEK